MTSDRHPGGPQAHRSLDKSRRRRLPSEKFSGHGNRASSGDEIRLHTRMLKQTDVRPGDADCVTAIHHDLDELRRTPAWLLPTPPVQTSESGHGAVRRAGSTIGCSYPELEPNPLGNGDAVGRPYECSDARRFGVDSDSVQMGPLCWLGTCTLTSEVFTSGAPTASPTPVGGTPSPQSPG